MPIFNIAYAPKTRSNDYVKITEKYKAKTLNYCIGIDSLPHVTVAQFVAEDYDINEIWSNICSSIEEDSVILSFSELSNITFNGEIYWLSLLPDTNKTLIETFKIVSNIVKPIRSDAYDPHLTLFNYIPDQLEIHLDAQREIKIQDEFELVLGKSDDVGQLIEIIYNYSSLFSLSKLSL